MIGEFNESLLLIDFTDAITEDWGGRPFQDLLLGWEFVLDKYPEASSLMLVSSGADYKLVDRPEKSSRSRCILGRFCNQVCSGKSVASKLTCLQLDTRSSRIRLWFQSISMSRWSEIFHTFRAQS